MHRCPLKCLLACTNSHFYVVEKRKKKLFCLYKLRTISYVVKWEVETTANHSANSCPFFLFYNRSETSSELMRSWCQSAAFFFSGRHVKWGNNKTAQRADSAIIGNSRWCQDCVLPHWALFIYLKPQKQLKSKLLTCKLHCLDKYKLLFKTLSKKKTIKKTPAYLKW